MQAALESALRELTFGPALDPANSEAVDAWLERHQVAESDRASLRGAELERLLIYRRLVRANLRDALELAIPRTIARLGARFDHYFDRFLAEAGPRTHYLRDVTSELLAFCSPLWLADANIPGYALDLARHEALHIEVAASPASSWHEGGAEAALELGLSFAPSARLVRYQYAVHRLSDSVDDRAEPAAEATELLVYRSVEHSVHYLELSPFAARLIEQLMTGASLRTALFSAAATSGHVLDQQMLASSAQLIADLSERGVVGGPPEMP